MLDGFVEHSDSIGNKGIIGAGDVQWMTAGSGILHQEMPTGDETGLMGGFQLWVNLPAAHKMTTPKYRDLKQDRIPQVTLDNGIKIRIINGQVGDIRGLIDDCITETEFLDIALPPNVEYFHPTRKEFNAFAYVIDGSAELGAGNSVHSNGHLILFEYGQQIRIATNKNSARMLLISGKPLGEPVAWRGPIVMNTQEELRVAFEEFRSGNFIKNS